jgi:hypothetical protein
MLEALKVIEPFRNILANQSVNLTVNPSVKAVDTFPFSRDHPALGYVSGSADSTAAGQFLGQQSAGNPFFLSAVSARMHPT